ncbi:MAG: T9SS type A sorting domain-containing protein, partial [candidate division Zixibacteria bacterium]
DEDLQGELLPIRYFWTGCKDNVFTGRDHRTLMAPDLVRDYDRSTIEPSDDFPTNSPEPCNPNSPRRIRAGYFLNGALKVAPPVPIVGDCDHDGEPYTTADADLFMQRFTGECDVEWSCVCGDINNDHRHNEVADLIQIRRIAMGQAEPDDSVAPVCCAVVSADSQERIVSVSADNPIGGLYLTFLGPLQVNSLHPETIISLHAASGKTYVLVMPNPSLASGAIPQEIPLFGYDRNTSLIGAQAATPDGARHSIEINQTENPPPGPKFTLRIEKDEGETGVGALQGHFTNVDVFLDSANGQIGGFNFLIAYNDSGLSLSGVSAGDALGECEWEYFTYRVGADGNCDTDCPSGLVRVVGIAETNNGPYHPDPNCDLHGAKLFSMEFLVTNDRTWECMFARVGFFFIECGDNSMTDKDGNVLFLTRTIQDYTGLGQYLGNYSDNLFGDDECNSDPFPTYRGHNCDCYIGGGYDKPQPIAEIAFLNGGVDIICAPVPDIWGDVNLDGLAYTIADAVMFTNYFVYGQDAFPNVSEFSVDGAIAATDVNQDGLTLTVADLVYLIRVVVGDATQNPQTTPIPVDVTITASGTISVPIDMGAAYIVVAGQVTPELMATNMTMESNYVGDSTKIIVYSLGVNEFFSGEFIRVNGDIMYLEMATYHGAPVDIALNSPTDANEPAVDDLPTEFTVSQNYPNPFNPRTSISFALPEASNYSVKIFNIQGQLIEEFSGNAGAGTHTVSWDASGRASGVYFYKVTTGDHSETQKMMLLK